jgi:hypothetical protein
MRLTGGGIEFNIGSIKNLIPQKRKIMLELNTIIESILWFAGRMIHEITLPKNMSKKQWKDLPVDYLIMQLKGEVEELEEEINQIHNNNLDFNAVIDECCDVANFAMMIADNARRGFYR